MSQSKKPRRKYNPNKYLTETPTLFRYSKAEGDAMKFRIYYHLGRMIEEDCDAGDYLAIKFRFKIGLGLVGLFNQPEATELLENGLAELERVKEQRVQTGIWKTTIETQNKLREALSLIDDIQDNTTRKEQLPVFIQAEKDIDFTLKETLP